MGVTGDNQNCPRVLGFGTLLMVLAVTGMLTIFFLTYITNLILFLLAFYPFFSLFVLSIILILTYYHKFNFSKKACVILATLLIGGILATLALDALVSLLTQIL